MIRLLQFLIHGCFHEWEVIDEGCCYVFMFGIAKNYTVKCKKCGTIKTSLAR